MEMKQILWWAGYVSDRANRKGDGARGEAYTKPSPKTAESAIFCLLGNMIVHTTGSGNKKIRKSVAICSPVPDHHIDWGAVHFLWMVKSQ